MTTREERRREKEQLVRMKGTARLSIYLFASAWVVYLTGFVLLYTGVTYFQSWPWREDVLISNLFGWQNGVLRAGILGGVALTFCAIGFGGAVYIIVSALRALWIVWIKKPYKEYETAKQKQKAAEKMPESVRKFFLIMEPGYSVMDEN